MISKLGLQRKFKGIFFFFKIHKLFPKKILLFLGCLSELSKWISKHKNLKYSDFYTYKFNYDKRYELYAYIIEQEKLNTEIDYLEFGVSKGLSFKWWMQHIHDPKSRFYGFDTFTGLPEDWGHFKKGSMSSGNRPPNIDDARGKFYQGLFQKTLIDFLRAYNSNKRKVIHLDADLYSSTSFVLAALTPYINKGDILFFDEFNVPLHEFKAFNEWTNSFYIDYEVLGAINNFYQIAVKIK